MKYIYIVLLLLTASSCKKSNTAGPELVERFVKEVKAERYEEIMLPEFDASHIDELMRHASDNQMVAIYPHPSYSSYYGGPVAVGLVMLYTIEAVRLQVEWPSSTVRVFDQQDLSREVPLSEVLPYYKKWWTENKGKSAAELMEADPLDGSGLTWHIYTTGE
ncbi:DUF4943 family protein [Parapedobacter sp. 10938]|uniref:DUF4943 family protein n=1 Tax=Parapedobacter flavus TaxID=3110225 RepID=UPI002DB6B342|nr:DUF4943 family protein [Parapedobacter sp. 10938]MEC3881617.1 DUF4943 family protein [Parapedobacter sp. 10938]